MSNTTECSISNCNDRGLCTFIEEEMFCACFRSLHWTGEKCEEWGTFHYVALFSIAFTSIILVYVVYHATLGLFVHVIQKNPLNLQAVCLVAATTSLIVRLAEVSWWKIQMSGTNLEPLEDNFIVVTFLLYFPIICIVSVIVFIVLYWVEITSKTSLRGKPIIMPQKTKPILAMFTAFVVVVLLVTFALKLFVFQAITVILSLFSIALFLLYYGIKVINMLKSFHHIQVFSNVDLDSVSQQKRPQDSSNSSDLTKSEESGKMRFQERLSSFIITLAIILLLSVIAGFIFLLDPESHTIHVIVDILFRVLEPAANLFIVYFLRIEEPRKVAIRSSAQKFATPKVGAIVPSSRIARHSVVKQAHKQSNMISG